MKRRKNIAAVLSIAVLSVSTFCNDVMPFSQNIVITASAATSSKLKAPTNIIVDSTDDNSVSLSWKSVKGADAYVVYKYNSSSNKFEEYGSTKKTKAVLAGLKSNTSYKFKVAAMVLKDDNFEVQKFSGEISAKTKKITIPTIKSSATMNYSDGSKYVGQWKNDKQNGQGIYYWDNGDIYIGQFKDDAYNGEGTYYWSGGSKYVGEEKNGEQNGQGTMAYSNGTVYSGQWSNGEWKKGTMTFTNGAKYVGDFKNSERNGKGVYTNLYGYKYEGEWKNDKANGKGAECLTDGRRYIGEFKDDLWNGKATLILSDGSRYEGNWKEGEYVNGKYYEAEGKYYSYNGHNYMVINKGMNWEESKAYCEKLGGHLLTISDKNEQKFVEKIIQNEKKDTYWIGLQYKGKKWKWIDGTKFKYKNWDSGQPDNYNGSEYFGQIYSKTVRHSDWTANKGKWNDSASGKTGNSGMGFICEWD